MGLPEWLSGKESAGNAGDARDTGLIPGSGKSPGGGHGYPLQDSCLGNSMDRGAWQATVRGVAEWDTERLSVHTSLMGSDSLLSTLTFQFLTSVVFF